MADQNQEKHLSWFKSRDKGVCVCVRACVRARAWVCVGVGACVRACVCVCVTIHIKPLLYAYHAYIANYY